MSSKRAMDAVTKEDAEEPPKKRAKQSAPAAGAGAEAGAGAASMAGKKLPRKRRVALFVSYLGTNYHGSTFVDDCENISTIENALFNAIVASGCISDVNSNDPRRSGLSRSSRTDKGVHALLATFSLKMSNLFENDEIENQILKYQENVQNEKLQRKKERQIAWNEKYGKESKESKDKEDKKNEKSKNDKENKNEKDKVKPVKEKEKGKDKENNDIDEIGIDNDKKKYLDLQETACDWKEMTQLINNHLPNDIKLHAIQRTTKKFEPRYAASSRVYHYLIPTYVFDKNMINTKQFSDDKWNLKKSFYYAKALNNIENKKNENNEKKEASNENSNENENDSCSFDQILKEMKRLQKKMDSNNDANNENGNEKDKDKVNDECANDYMLNKKEDPRIGYRMNKNDLNRLKIILSKFEKTTKNYHNFTRKTNSEEGRANRYIVSIDIINESIVHDNIEFILIKIHGNSFMYHQIRKMIGFIVCLMRCYHWKPDESLSLPNNNEAKSNEEMLTIAGLKNENFNENEWDSYVESVMNIAFSRKYKMAIPLAPSCGLYLSRVIYDSYNNNCDKLGLYWNKINFEKYEESVNEFETNMIIPAITKHETNENEFAYWIYDVDSSFLFEYIHITSQVMGKIKETGHNYIAVGNQKQLRKGQILTHNKKPNSGQDASEKSKPDRSSFVKSRNENNE